MKNAYATTILLPARPPKINHLMLSAGQCTFGGREDTEEGIGRRLAPYYYARWEFVSDLLPLRRKAKDAGEDAKVMSVLAPRAGIAVDIDNLGLKKTYAFPKARGTIVTYTN